MKLIELIPYLVHPGLFKELYQEEGLPTESEALLIYMKEDLNIESDITIFEIEETEDDLIFEKDGIKYYQLFPVNYAVDLIESDLQLKDNGYSDLEIAQRLLDYRLRDA
jgi:hypothetical protein